MSSKVMHYKNVFKERDITENLKDFKATREKLHIDRLELASQIKGPEWSIEDVTCVLKEL